MNYLTIEKLSTELSKEISTEIIDFLLIVVVLGGLFLCIYTVAVFFKRLWLIKEKTDIVDIVFLMISLTIVRSIVYSFLIANLNITNSYTYFPPFDGLLFDFALFFILFFAKAIKDLLKGFSFQVIKSNIIYFFIVLFFDRIIVLGDRVIIPGTLKMWSMSSPMAISIGAIISIVIFKVVININNKRSL